MSGGLYDKLGNWYEQDYVCLLWLRLLSERLQSVTWEPGGADERGVDAWVEQEGRRIAFQCKSRRTGNWTSSALIEDGILSHAKEQLERPDGFDEYRLVTTTDAPALRELRAWAVAKEAGQTLGRRAVKLAEALGLDPDRQEDAERLRDLIMRIDVEILGERTLREHVRDLAEQLAGPEGERLVSELRGLRSMETLRTLLRGDLLRAALSQNIRWRTIVDSESVLEKVQDLVTRFVADAQGRHRIDPPLERPENRRLLELVRSGGGARTIVVHGDAGSGKSDVIATAVESWPVERGLVVPVQADEAGLLIDERPSLEQIVLVAGAGRVTLVVDQLDQVLEAGVRTQTRLRDLTRLLREARRLGCTLIVGCRTADARHDTQLRQLLHAGTATAVEELEVGDLPEAAVTRVLSRAGVAWTSLGRDVQRLIRRPVCLGIVLDLTGEHGWQGSRTLHELVEQWWRTLAAGDARKDAALDALVAVMESRGCLAVDRLLLADHGSAIDDLLRAGALQLDSRSRIRPAHQALVDMRLARELGGSRDSAAALQRLGRREEQGTHQARRLRHAVTIFANQGQSGAAILDGLYRSVEVRPLLKRAMLLGLAHERAPLPPALVGVVLGWLSERGSVEAVSRTLLFGHGDWTMACRAWLDEAWSEGDEECRDLLLHLLASISEKHGDFVAELLESWARTDPAVLSRAHLIFWQDPSDDSDALFRMRMAAPGPVGLPKDHLDWRGLFEANAERAAVLLAAVLRDRQLELTRLSGTGRRSLPRPSDLQDSALAAAGRIWCELRDWWLGLELDSLRSISTGSQAPRAAPLVELVQILARCLAHQLDEESLSWGALLEQLPDPLRELDAWLLLTTGALLGGRSKQAVEEAAEWIRREERFALLRVGWSERHWDLQLIRGFVAKLGPMLSDEGFAQLESWILRYRDPWTPRDERARLELAREHGRLLPSDAGLLAYRTLPELPEERLSLGARARLAECKRKFDAVAQAMLSDLSVVEGGFLGSKVPRDVLQGLEPAEWVVRLREAPDQDRNWKRLGEDSVGVYDKDALVGELGALAGADPTRYLEVAKELARAEPPFEGEVYRTILSSIARTRAPSGDPGAEAWRPVGDMELARLTAHPSYLRSDACARELGLVVEERARYDWPDAVVHRLVEIASASSSSEGSATWDALPPAERLLEIQWNDDACVALRGLTALARHHSGRHEKLLEVAARLVDVDPPARRAAAGVLAHHCALYDAGQASDLLLRAAKDPQVAASRDCFLALFALLNRPETGAEVREGIARTLLYLASSHDPDIAERGGRALVGLRGRGLVDDPRMRDVLRSSPMARKGAAEQIGRWLDDGDRNPWILDLAIELADDEHAEVGDAILEHVTDAGNRAVLQNRSFVERVIATSCGRRRAEWLLRALDEEASLSVVSGLVLDLAERVLAGPQHESEEPDTWARYGEAQALGGLLARLVEECERNEDAVTRTRTLDAWDRLIESRPREMGPLIDARTI